jgi:two-component system sensor histidine kinase CpxA
MKIDYYFSSFRLHPSFMRSLFFKIFLWFWLAMALMGIALLAVTWTTRAEPVVPAQRAFLGDAMKQNARIAVWRWQKRGKADVNAYLARMENKARCRAFLLDAGGNFITGPTRISSDAGIKALAHQATKRDEVEFQISGVDLRAAHRARGSDGKTYVLLASMPRSILSALRVEPRTRLLRIGSMMLVTGLICFILARYLADPVVKLRHATQRFAAGDLSVRVRPQLGHRRDELADLAGDFDAMATQISSLLTAQRRLLGDVSHELRTPLTRLNLALELARRHAGQDATPALNRIEHEAQQLNALIEQLLALSRLESGDKKPSHVSIDLSQMLSDIVGDSHLEADATCRQITVQAEDCFVEGIPAILRSAIENVIRNALHHTPENSSIEIRLTCEEKMALLTVRDHGPGVPEMALSEIFRPFYRVDDARDRPKGSASGGAGLGLAIVERAVTSHSGQVHASNAADGGLVVEIHIPR